MFDIPLETFLIGIGAVGVILLPLVPFITRQFKKHREELESEVLRQYPELAEIVATQKSRGSGVR